MTPYRSDYPLSSNPPGVEDNHGNKNYFEEISLKGNDQSQASSFPPPPPPPTTTSSSATATSVTWSNPSLGHLCGNFVFPPPPPAGSKRIGPRRKFEVFLHIVLLMNFLHPHTFNFRCKTDCQEHIKYWLQPTSKICSGKVFVDNFLFSFYFQHAQYVISL